ncbi:unnamed protein product [Caenorhabditis bovis]|uniref:Uncharacterized protein n=1 Tax=Caenorhabditis bovis TaxID=2654633 RepID=A0A8S1FAZ6_9PELO|nr:unnamed protein product [Caenorhabditis bovis]
MNLLAVFLGVLCFLATFGEAIEVRRIKSHRTISGKRAARKSKDPSLCYDDFDCPGVEYCDKYNHCGLGDDEEEFEYNDVY